MAHQAQGRFRGGGRLLWRRALSALREALAALQPRLPPPAGAGGGPAGPPRRWAAAAAALARDIYVAAGRVHQGCMLLQLRAQTAGRAGMGRVQFWRRLFYAHQAALERQRLVYFRRPPLVTDRRCRAPATHGGCRHHFRLGKAFLYPPTCIRVDSKNCWKGSMPWTVLLSYL